MYCIKLYYVILYDIIYCRCDVSRLEAEAFLLGDAEMAKEGGSFSASSLTSVLAALPRRPQVGLGSSGAGPEAGPTCLRAGLSAL